MELIARPSWVVDVAGAFQGGAARFLRELDGFLSDSKGDQIMVIGRGQRLTSRWLIEREILSRGIRNRLALNNASFVGGSVRTVLLRNALHFAYPGELSKLNYRPPIDLRVQVPVVRTLALRASNVIVPSEAMAERVVRVLPSAKSRICVRFHPVSPIRRAFDASPQDKILMPVVASPYKQLEFHVLALLDALDELQLDTQVIMTSTPDGYSDEVVQNPRAIFIGRQPSESLDPLWTTISAVYFPPIIEAFGYPLAEARVNGIPVIAPDRYQDVAGPALRSYGTGDRHSLRLAVEAALRGPRPPADPMPFDRIDYFESIFKI